MEKTHRDFKDYRQFLQQELVDRCKKNPNYSLRSFAKNLGVTPSLLSRVLSGKRKVSQVFLSKTALSLNLPFEEIQKFQKRLKFSIEHIDGFETLALESLEAISDWTHYAVFELLDTKNFKSNEKWIAKRLGVSIHEIHSVLERLQAIGVIQKDKKGKYKKLKDSIATTGHQFTVLAFQKLQMQFLDKAKDAMREIPIERRDQSAMIMAIDSSRMEEAKSKIKKFRYEMIEFLQETNNSDEVYTLAVSLYPLTKKEEKT